MRPMGMQVRHGVQRRLVAVRVGVGVRPPLPARVGLGDTSAADTALQAMVTDINTNGCQQTAQASVTQFQTAYNSWITSGGGVTPVTVNGLYNSETQNAAELVNQTDGLNLTVPPSCVTASPTSTSPTQTVNVTTASSGATPYLVAGAVAVTAIGAFAWYHWHAQKPGARVVRTVVRRRRAA